MKLKIQFDEEARFGAPLRQTSRTKAAMFSGMTHRRWLSSAFVRSRLRNIMVRHRNVIKIPTGFQDKTGFHFGIEAEE
jgi:hypothetical protein